MALMETITRGGSAMDDEDNEGEVTGVPSGELPSGELVTRPAPGGARGRANGSDNYSIPEMTGAWPPCVRE